MKKAFIFQFPHNVWFIGTANNDETTMGFADKTYDRAFILELPDNKPENIPSQINTIIGGITYDELFKVFATAQFNQVNKTETILNIFK